MNPAETLNPPDDEAIISEEDCMEINIDDDENDQESPPNLNSSSIQPPPQTETNSTNIQPPPNLQIDEKNNVESISQDIQKTDQQAHIQLQSSGNEESTLYNNFKSDHKSISPSSEVEPSDIVIDLSENLMLDEEQPIQTQDHQIPEPIQEEKIIEEIKQIEQEPNEEKEQHMNSSNLQPSGEHQIQSENIQQSDETKTTTSEFLPNSDDNQISQAQNIPILITSSKSGISNKAEEIQNEDESEEEIEYLKKLASQCSEIQAQSQGSNKQNPQNSQKDNNIKQPESPKKQINVQEDKDETKKNSISVCEAPQTIASIFSQLAKVFQNILIPQSLVNMSLQRTIESPEINEKNPMQFSATMQEQINQLQNQVTSIQSTVIHIPDRLKEVTDILGNAFSNKEIANKIVSKTTKPTQPKEVKPKKKLPIVSESESEEEEDEDEEESEKGQSSSEESELEEESSDSDEVVKNIVMKSKIAPVVKSVSVAPQRINGVIQPKIGFSAPKTLITPQKQSAPVTPSKVEHQTSPQPQQSAPNITINAANLGFREPKLFINESERIEKLDDLHTEELELKALYETLNQLDQPLSFLLLKEQFPDLQDSQILETIRYFKEKCKLGIVELFLAKYSKCKSVRMDYYFADMIIPVKTAEEQKDNSAETKKDIPQVFADIQNVGDRSKFDSMTDEQLLSYQKELNLRKQSLLDKKQNANPTSDRIKKIQQWNEMKEICSTVFERIAVLKGKRITEICDDFGVKLDV